MKTDKLLGEGKILPTIGKLALPAVAAQLVNLLYSLVDRIYIGHIPEVGTDALAGLGVSGTVILLVSAFASFVGGGGGPLASIALGQKNRERAERILGNCVVLVVGFCAICLALCYSLMGPLLHIAGASDITEPYAREYLNVYLIGTLFVISASGLNMFISAQGKSRVAMTSVLIGAVLNTLLDPLFIFAFGLGIRGAAIATVIAQGVSAIFVVGFLMSEHSDIRLRSCYIGIDRELMRSILSLGVSPFVMASTESLVGFALNGTLSKFGDAYVSALTIMQSAMQMISIPLMGFTQGVSPLIGYNFGHRDHVRVKETFRYMQAIGVCFNFFGFLFMILFPGVVASAFTRDIVLIGIVKQYMPIFLLGMLIFGLQRVRQITFVALGDAKISVVIALLRKVILLVPLVLVFSRLWGVVGVFIAEAVADATAALSCTAIFHFRFPYLLARNKTESLEKAKSIEE